MTLRMRIAIGLLALGGMFTALEVGKDYGVPGAESFVPQAEAVVGRPLTPVSVAGVSLLLTCYLLS